MYIEDEWPKSPDDAEWDGKDLLSLCNSGNSPFRDYFKIELLIEEVEKFAGCKLIDIPTVHHGSNNYGFDFEMENQVSLLARLGRSDVNMPEYDGWPFEKQVPGVKFEAAAYDLLRSEPSALASHLVYYRVPVQYSGAKSEVPDDILGRSLLIFRADKGDKGDTDLWKNLRTEEKNRLLEQAASIRASFFNLAVPPQFSTDWFLDRLLEHKPERLPIPVAPTREFCIAVFISKIEVTIREIGDMIGWESDNATVGPVAFAAKHSLKRIVPYILPPDDDRISPYRLVLDHGDFGIHNMLITEDENRQARITSVFDLEIGSLAPALLSDPLMAVTVDLVVDENAGPSITRVNDDDTPEERVPYLEWSKTYFKALFREAPNYEHAIKAGKDARYLWYALRDWRGEDPEGYFGNLGTWAEKRLQEILGE